ncbi:MAG: hypothetical protein ACRENJ_10510, partial [Candidatus Eiseniibacteriota bacterium]
LAAPRLSRAAARFARGFGRPDLTPLAPGARRPRERRVLLECRPFWDSTMFTSKRGGGYDG